jgi:hypothetical protein
MNSINTPIDSVNPANATNAAKILSDKNGVNNMQFSYNRVLLKIKYSFYSALVFFLFANPETIIILQGFFGKYVSFIYNNAITMSGVFATTFLFFVTILGLMLLPSD